MNKKKKETKEIKIRGVPIEVYNSLLEMKEEENRPSLNNLLVVKLIEMTNNRRKK